jgi:hypothetical protein
MLRKRGHQKVEQFVDQKNHDGHSARAVLFAIPLEECLLHPATVRHPEIGRIQVEQKPEEPFWHIHGRLRLLG